MDKSQKDYKAMLQQHDGQICGRFQQKQIKSSASFAKAAAFAALSFADVHLQNLVHQYIPLWLAAQHKTRSFIPLI